MGVFGKIEVLVIFSDSFCTIALQWQHDNRFGAAGNKFPANSMVTSNLPVLIALIDCPVQASSSNNQPSLTYR